MEIAVETIRPQLQRVDAVRGWVDVFRAHKGTDGEWYPTTFVARKHTFESDAVRLLVREGTLSVGEPVLCYRRSTHQRGGGGSWLLPAGWTA